MVGLVLLLGVRSMLERNQINDLSILLTQLIKEDETKQGFDDELKSISHYKAYYLQEPRYDFIPFIKHDKMVAFAIGQQFQNEYHVIMNYVSPEYRGEGIGSRLKSQLVDKAKERDCDIIYSIIRADNKASLRMNIKAGWGCDKQWLRFKKNINNH